MEFTATTGVEIYAFTFKNQEGDVVDSFELEPLRRVREAVFKNLSLALIGRADDGEGNSNLRVIQINNF